MQVYKFRMYTQDFQKGDEIIQKDRSASTSSFYLNPIKPRTLPKSNNQLSHLVQTQERQTLEAIQKFKLALEIKSQYIQKRSEQLGEQSKKILAQLVEAEKYLSDSIKNIHKNDKTKQWFQQMQKTILGIMSTSKQSQQKNLNKYLNECKQKQRKCDELQDRKRQQKKERQKQWQSMIDSVGATIINAQGIIQQQREQMQAKMLQLERGILDIEQLCISSIQDEKTNRKQEHQYLSKLIERIMDKLIF